MISTVSLRCLGDAQVEVLIRQLALRRDLGQGYRCRNHQYIDNWSIRGGKEQPGRVSRKKRRVSE